MSQTHLVFSQWLNFPFRTPLREQIENAIQFSHMGFFAHSASKLLLLF